MTRRRHRSSREHTPWLVRELALETEIAWLILLSLLDVVLTWALLYRGPQFVESNPLAAWVFRRYNMTGLVAYKFILIAIVVVIAELAERAIPGRGRFVLRVGIVAAGAVVVYSLWLNLQHPMVL